MSEELKNQLEVYGANQDTWPVYLRSLLDTVNSELYPLQDL